MWLINPELNCEKMGFLLDENPRRGPESFESNDCSSLMPMDVGPETLRGPVVEADGGCSEEASRFVSCWSSGLPD